MNLNPFNAANPLTEAELRPTNDVFKTSAAGQAEGFKSRFASSGQFTSAQLENGNDADEAAEPEAEPDPDDKRSLYDRLKEQKDAKQEEWEHKHTFKNQMDHWRLDEDEASFEDDRLERLRQQQAEKARLDEESAQFYQLARASRELKVTPAPAAPPAPSLDSGPPAEKRKRRDAQLPAFKVHKKVADAPRAPAPAAAPAAAPVEAPAGCGGGLPGMDAYGDDDSD